VEVTRRAAERPAEVEQAERPEEEQAEVERPEEEQAEVE
jgi:hypothetical protein